MYGLVGYAEIRSRIRHGMYGLLARHILQIFGIGKDRVEAFGRSNGRRMRVPIGIIYTD
jgi:hypothetical protein